MEVHDLNDPIDFIFWARKQKKDFGCDAAMNAVTKTFTKNKSPLKPIEMVRTHSLFEIPFCTRI